MGRRVLFSSPRNPIGMKVFAVKDTVHVVQAVGPLSTSLRREVFTQAIAACVFPCLVPCPFAVSHLAAQRPIALLLQ